MLFALARIATDTSPADACSCGGDELRVPAPGATDVPLNLAGLIGGGGGAVVRSAGSEVRATGELRPIGQLFANLLEGPLLPARRYEVWDSARPLYAFTTGTSVDLEPPGAVSLVDVSIADATVILTDENEISSCAPNELLIRGRVEGGEGGALIGVRFERDGKIIERVLPPGSRELANLGTGTCLIQTRL